MVKSKTIPNAFVELNLGLMSDVDIHFSFDFQNLLFMVDFTTDDSIPECLGHHEFNVFFWNVQLIANVVEVNVGVSCCYFAETDPDHNLVESENHCIEPIFEEAVFMGLDQFVEILEFSLKDHLNELIVRVGVGKNENI